MSKKIKQPSFIERVIELAAAEGDTEKNQTAHKGWSLLFSAADESEKRALAIDWLRHFARVEIPARGDKSFMLHRGMMKHQAWFEKIAPYLVPGSLEVSNFACHNFDFDHVLTDCPTTSPESATLRKMWFGTDAEKLECLGVSLHEKDLMEFCSAAGPLSAKLAWSVAELPGAGRRHHIIACLLSYWTGYLLEDPNPETAPEAAAWQYMGLYTKGANQFKPGANSKPSYLEYYEKIKYLPDFCREASQQSPVEVMCAVFPRMMSYVPKLVKGGITTGALLTHGLPADSDVLSILLHWLPQCKTQIEVARAAGFTLDELMAALPQLVEPTTAVQMQLPDDFHP